MLRWFELFLRMQTVQVLVQLAAGCTHMLMANLGEHVLTHTESVCALACCTAPMLARTCRLGGRDGALCVCPPRHMLGAIWLENEGGRASPCFTPGGGYVGCARGLRNRWRRRCQHTPLIIDGWIVARQKSALRTNTHPML